MSETITVRPGKGLIVRKEDFSFLDPAGETVPLTKYVRRRLACGDMVEVTTESNPKAGKPANKKGKPS